MAWIVGFPDGLNLALQSLSDLTRNFQGNTFGVPRIQRGSTRAGALRPIVERYRYLFCTKTAECHQILNTHAQSPGINYLLQQLTVFDGELDNVLSKDGRGFSEAGNDVGYCERVHVLENLNFMNGTLHGVIQTNIWIEHQRLTFNETSELSGPCI